MLVWQWGLVLSSSLFFISLIFISRRYFTLKKDAAEWGVKGVDERDSHQNVPTEAEKAQWLALLEQQRNICSQLMAEVPSSDLQGKAALTCWAIFLDVEIHIIEQSAAGAEVLPLLDAFKPILDKVEHAQEIDGLLKFLKVNQSLLRELNKVIQKAGEKVFTQVRITSELNFHLKKLQNELLGEAELDAALALSRAEIASLCELADRLKLHLAEVRGRAGSEHYADALGDFLKDAEQSVFLLSVGSELDDKVADLKQLAEYQKSIIADLKEQVSRVRYEHDDDEKHIGVYDIYIVRLEKALLESSRVVKRLEGKLNSLQTIKYNLNIDLRKRDEALEKKRALLEKQTEIEQQAEKENQTENNIKAFDIYAVFDKERDTMDNMEDLLQQGSFTKASDVFATDQASKIAALRVLLSESELYVEVLERDLDKAKALREDLEGKLRHPETTQETGDGETTIDTLVVQDQTELDNLREINAELDEERKRLEAALADGRVQTEEFLKLQQKVDELSGKIDLAQKNYIEMEERYVAALMAQGGKHQ
ncbi:hypothetical protein HGG82_11000 [Marinomonas sp. M1K-6]|uniref:Uncharacterized protein n=1 Tax=Marinomonas profundi TaxID=2726122 RepID=A0A847QX68_9GAMM|nr:hypothetical protein [Marinomonas profundi]NLQ18148.1 hypothetical protein [Marinomonas profundi]UDV04070.1 hypothetical protein J8N69_04725 [Marinomonas profundi]